MKKRHREKVKNTRKNYRLKNITEHVNLWDGETSVSGTLYYKNVKIIKFYEHGLEGGYYPNGEPFNKKRYDEFINFYSNGKCDEMDAFHKGIKIKSITL